MARLMGEARPGLARLGRARFPEVKKGTPC